VPVNEDRPAGAVQRFADRAGGPALYEGTGYQTGVAISRALALLLRQQQSPLTVFRLRCESRSLVPGGQFGFDLGEVTPETDFELEMKASPVRDEILELLARLPTARDSGRALRLVHGKVTKWTEALDLLVRNSGEAANDDQLIELVHASNETARQTLLDSVPVSAVGPKALLNSMGTPEFLARAPLNISSSRCRPCWPARPAVRTSSGA